MKYLLLFSVVLSMGLVANPLFAENFFVDSNGDDAATPGTLRHAIASANANAEEDAITFDSSIFFIGLLNNGPLVISSTEKITIDASSLANPVAISGFEGNGASPSRVFEVNAGASLEMINIEVTDGKAPDGADGTDGLSPTDGEDGENGGGIYNEGTLVLRDCQVRFNEAGNGGKGGDKTGVVAGATGLSGKGGDGGGIYSTGDGARLEMYDCIVTDNAAGSGGNGGSVATGSPGTASNGGAGGNGGGVASWDQTTTRIERTKFEQNRAGMGGIGGVDGNPGTGGNGGEGGRGGAIAMEVPTQMEDVEASGTFYPLIKDSVFSNNNNKGLNNAAGGSGGDDGAVVTDTPGDGGKGGGGGAIWVDKFNAAEAGTSHVAGCLFQQNFTGVGGDGENGGKGGDGGAVLVSPPASEQDWKMENCTFTLNEARSGGATLGGGSAGDAGKGGAIALATGAGDYTATLSHLTIVGNRAGANGQSGEGGGIWEADNGNGGIAFGGRGLTLANSIVSLNQADTDPNVKTGFLPDGNNLVGGDPDLGDLTDLGGATQVFPPNLSSPAIDGGGTLANPITTDQRGFSRPKGASPDIGAVEIGVQADARIGTKSNPATHLINNFYSASASGQTKKLKLKKRRKGKMYFSVENDGDLADAMTLRGTKPNRKVRLKVIQLTGGQGNVSSAVIAGYAMGEVNAGSNAVFQVQAKARSKKKKARQNLIYTATSNSGGSADAVMIQVRQKKK